MKKSFKITLTVFALCVLCSGLWAQSSKKSKETPEEDKKNYMGWIDTSNQDVAVKIGNLRLNTKTRLGTFNISVIDDEGKRNPVFFSGNEYSSTGFFLKVNNTVYQLIAQPNIKTAARKTKNGMQMNYSIKDVAEVFVDFKCMESAEGSGIDMIKITSTVTNKSAKKNDFALKLVLDTVLGESTQAHFYTSSNVPVKSEALYRTMKNEKWFVSKNKHAQMQILLDGADITEPEVVALANLTTLEKNTWEPEMLSYRTFDTVLSYNNSAVGIIWPGKKLAVDGRNTNAFYLAFGTDSQPVNGAEFIAQKAAAKEIDVSEAVANLANPKKEEKTEVPATKPVETPVETPAVVEKTAEIPVEQPVVKVVEQVVVPPQEPPVPVVTARPAPVTPPRQVPVVVEAKKPRVNPNSLTSRQLTPAYIQNLIDRITALENDPDQASEEEIKLLNDELDAILQALM